MIKKNKNSLYLIFSAFSFKGQPQSPKGNLTYIYSLTVKYQYNFHFKPNGSDTGIRFRKAFFFYYPFFSLWAYTWVCAFTYAHTAGISEPESTWSFQCLKTSVQVGAVHCKNSRISLHAAPLNKVLCEKQMFLSKDEASCCGHAELSRLQWRRRLSRARRLK